MEQLRVGVIGTGHLGSFHAKQFMATERSLLVGVFDVQREKAAALGAELGIRSYASVEELLSAVDAVSIATVTKSHYHVAVAALEMGVHVFVEKPITATISEAERLVALAKERKLKIQVGHIERFNPAILALEKFNLNPLFIESHRLAQFNPRGADVAVVMDLMIHDIDLILSLVRSKVERIDANGVAVVSDSADIANARLQFENGCVANVTASRISQHKMRKMRMFQHDAYISIDFAQGMSEVFRLMDENDPSAQATMLLGKIDQGPRKRLIVYEQPETKEINALRYELQLFINCIADDTVPAVSGEDGLQALIVAEEILRKIAGQKMVMK